MSEKNAQHKPVDPDDSVGLITTVTIVALAGGLVIPLLGGSIGPTHGLRASVRLEHERREAVVREALDQYNTAKSQAHSGLEQNGSQETEDQEDQGSR